MTEFTTTAFVPAVRLVVVEVYHCDGDDKADHEIRPVVAVHLRLGDNGPEYVPIVVGPHGELEPDDEWPCENAMRKVFACPWPATEDEERLAKHISDVKRDLVASLSTKTSATA